VKYLQLCILSAGLLTATAACSAPGVRVLIQAAGRGAIINEALYGQELGAGSGGAAGGLWVGPGSAVPNIKGWRLDMVEALRQLHVPALRWPAGCRADDYHWRDGVGAREQRPLRRDPDGTGGSDDNSVGTHEFFDLVELTGTSAYVSTNVGTGSAREAADWVEYMEAETGSTLGQWRAQHGHPQPFKPRYLGVGQTPWACGGNMTPQYYADLYNQYAVFIRGKSTHPSTLIANGNGALWTDELSTKKRVRDYQNAIGANYAASAAGSDDRDGAGGADEVRWISTLKRALSMDQFIAANLARLKKNDPARKLSLVIGGWSTSDPIAAEGGPDRAAQRNTLRDALAASLHFHVLHVHADRVGMASYAAPLNSPQSMLQAEEGRLILTPAYYAFRMHVPFQGATALPLRLDHQARYTVGRLSIPALSVSAARGKDGKLYLSLVNANPSQALAVAVQLAGAVPVKASGSVLTAPAMEAYNSLAAPEAVAPMPIQVRGEHGQLRFTLPSKSLTVVAIDE
jgi:alpha-N-arabinofuranosidase